MIETIWELLYVYIRTEFSVCVKCTFKGIRDNETEPRSDLKKKSLQKNVGFITWFHCEKNIGCQTFK